MKVIALKEGFFDGTRIRAGDEFDVPQGTKGSWFTPVKEPKAADARDVKAEAKAKAEADTKAKADAEAKAKADAEAKAAGAKGKNPDDLV